MSSEENNGVASGHTPGPWVPSKFGFQVLTGDSWSTICTLKGDACWEDGRGNYQQEYEWQRQEANACLIAEAPNLLTILAEIVDEFGGSIAQYHKIGPDYTFKDGTEVFEASVLLDREALIERARNAITKVRPSPSHNILAGE